MFTAWLAQIILSEVIGIPTVIETGKRQTCEFYDPQNKFSYATAGYNLPAMYTSRIDKMGKCTCKADQLDASGYCPCANAHTEVWEGQLSNLADGQASNDLTYGGSLGELVSSSFTVMVGQFCRVKRNENEQHTHFMHSPLLSSLLRLSPTSIPPTLPRRATPCTPMRFS